MSIVLTKEQRALLQRGEAVRVISADNGEEVVVLRGAEYEAIREILEEERSRQAIAKVALQTAAEWAKENPF